MLSVGPFDVVFVPPEVSPDVEQATEVRVSAATVAMMAGSRRCRMVLLQSSMLG
jgi:hypothetical protein